MKPRAPSSIVAASDDGHVLQDEATYRRLEFTGDLTGQSVELVDFEQCRFNKAALGGTRLDRGTFTDCLLLNSDVANLHADKASMRRVRLRECRMTGMQWVNGAMHDVVVADCRADLSSFRFTGFRNVEFSGCNLTRADFQNADVSGVRFTNCDLTLAQFSHAMMTDTRFANCKLEGIGGVTSFTGAVVAEQDLTLLVYALTGALGIRIERQDD